MNVRDIGEILLYDKVKFELYLKYHDEFDNSSYLSFEEFLLCENNLQEYLEDEDKINKKYLEYHKDEPINDYENFKLFCNGLHIFPYEKSKLEDIKTCNTCIHYGHIKNLITGDEYDDCTIDEMVNYYGECEYHQFDVDKVEPIVRTLRK